MTENNFFNNQRKQFNAIYDALSNMEQNTPNIDLNGREEQLAKKEAERDEDDARDDAQREEVEDYREANERDTNVPY